MLSENIKKARNDSHLSQRALADIIGVSQQTVGSWEVGRTSPDNEMLKKLASFFNVSVDYLLSRTDEPGGLQKDDRGNEAVAEKEVKTVKPKAYVELHRLIDELPHSDVEELLNTAIFKKKKAEQAHEHVDDPDDF
ncbi:helix-turn-helix domain-containing protein [Selenomonas montiformis]|uniref:helix-turn-helix domain-containing protein n=1 Tax=Selenomonas montiformis TaxID=2652285 RepID=UPI003F945E4E